MSKFRNHLILLIFILINIFIVATLLAANVTFVENFSNTTYANFSFLPPNIPAFSIWDTANSRLTSAQGQMFNGAGVTSCTQTVDNITKATSNGYVYATGYKMGTDASDRDHIIWVDKSRDTVHQDIYYSYFNGTNWSGRDSSDGLSGYDRIFTNNNPVLLTDLNISFDSNNYPHIAWTYDNSTVYYRRWNGSLWSGAGSSSYDSWSGTQPKIGVDGSNDPMVVYKSGESMIKYIKATSGSWGASETAVDFGSDYSISVMPETVHVDSNDQPQIVWTGNDSTGNHFAFYTYRDKNTNTWKSANGSNGYDNLFPAVLGGNCQWNCQYDPARVYYVNDNPNIIWTEKDSNDIEILFTKWNGTNWVNAAGSASPGYDNVTNDSVNQSALYMDKDANNNPNILLTNSGNAIKFTKWTPGVGWTYSDGTTSGLESIANGIIAGIAVDSNDYIYISYRSGGSSPYNLNFNKLNPTTAVYTATTYNLSVDIFTYSDASGDVHIAYGKRESNNVTNNIYHLQQNPQGSYACAQSFALSQIIGYGLDGANIDYVKVHYTVSSGAVAQVFVTGNLASGKVCYTPPDTGINLSTCIPTVGGNPGDAAGAELIWGMIIDNTSGDTRTPMTAESLAFTFDGRVADLRNPWDITVTGNVDPVLKFDIVTDSDTTLDTSTCALGTLAVNTPATCLYRIGAGTNAINGFTIYAQDVSTVPGLTSASGSNIDPVADGLVDSGEEYGFRVSSLASGVTAGGTYAIQDNPVPTSATTFLSVTAPYDYQKDGTATDTSEIAHRVIISASTPAGYYTQTIRYTVTGNF